MSYTYEQRKRPQGRENTAPERTTAPGTGHNALMPGPAIPQSSPSFDLDGAMQARMKSTFGDLSAVRDYTPPVREQAPLQTGPYTGPVTHALSGASPSPSAAGPMQAKKETETKSVDRDYYEDEIVNKGAEGYDALDPKEWMTVTRTPTGIPGLFKKAKTFKARIARKAYELSPEELRKNKYNPGQSKSLGAFQNTLMQGPAPLKGETEEQTNGRSNRDAWTAFQRFAGNPYPDTKQEDEKTDWDMSDMDHEILTSKLKNMSRMVQDYPELKGNIGTLIRTGGGKKNKDSDTDDELGSAYMATKPAFNYTDSSGSGGQRERIRSGAFPLVMNAMIDAPGEIGRQRRERRNQGRVENNRHAAEMEYSGNHEMGHMLNYLLVKEMNRKKGSTDRLFANKEDFDFQVTANKLVDKALKANMSEDEYNSLVRYGKDVPKKKGDTTAHKAGQINFSANKLGGDKDSRGYTSNYGATDAAEFFAEAFADVYRNGSEARSTSITLVKLYEKNMKYFKAKNAGEKMKLTDKDREDLLLD